MQFVGGLSPKELNAGSLRVISRWDLNGANRLCVGLRPAAPLSLYCPPTPIIRSTSDVKLPTFSLKLAVIPFRTEPVMPNRSLGYFLETVQWLDAISPPLEEHLGILVERVKQVPADGLTSTAGAPAITPDSKA